MVRHHPQASQPQYWSKEPRSLLLPRLKKPSSGRTRVELTAIRSEEPTSKDRETTERVINQGRGLVHTIEGLSVYGAILLVQARDR